MKALKNSLFVGLLALLSASSAYAGGGDLNDAPSTSVARNNAIVKEVTRHISYPAIKAVNPTEFVLVSFRTEACGMITVLESNASNREFEAFVVNKLNGMKITNPDNAVHNVRFAFKQAAPRQ